MISCSFNGRLGNNLFQIASTIALAKTLNTDFIFEETTWAGHRGRIPVDLSMFDYKFPRAAVKLSNQYQESNFHYTPLPLQDDLQMNGFFQSWKYFENVREELLETYFQPSKEVKQELSKYTVTQHSLGISVRRGDYLMLQGNHCVLDLDYYQTVLDKYFTDNVDQIYIFSDDIQWCKKVFGEDVILVQDTIGTQLFLMSKMKHLILSNSTFAWWGAYLNQQGGLVIAPSPWFGPNYQDKETSDLYYPSWIIENHIVKQQPFTITPLMYN